MLEITNLSKTFPGQIALRGVSLNIEKGSVHTLVGQNGSGKSTLIKILAGFHDPDPGATANFNGESYVLGSADDAKSQGLRFVHQDLGLVGSLSAVENFALVQGYGVRAMSRVRWNRLERSTHDSIAALGHEIDVRTPVQNLTAVERTMVAIGRAVADRAHARVLVLDEPTAALPIEDVIRLFQSIRQLRDDGLAVLFVSHHLDEVMELADRVSVLRDGRLVASLANAELREHKLAELIVGHVLDKSAERRTAPSDVPIRLSIDCLRSAKLSSFSLKVSAGEIVGIAGLEGSGREVLAPVIGGMIAGEGRIIVDGQEVELGRPDTAIRRGLVCLSRDRALFGIVPTMSVRENLTISNLSPFTRWRRIARDRERKEAQSWIDKLNIVCGGQNALITTLSGGNQQKVLFARALRLVPKALVLDEPTQGVDVGAREEFHRLIEEEATNMAVVVLSSDSDELERLCHRVIVLQRGEIARTLHRNDDLTRSSIDHALLGLQTV